jgi:thiosulfate/3-mercaptopyruvate sulfurtransferase
LDPFISVSNAAARRDLRLIDCRDGAAVAEDPVEGAARAPIERWVAETRRGAPGIGDPAWWGQEIAALGLGDGGTAAVFDDGRMTEAARVWFLLQHFGARALIVDGGLPALRTGARVVSAPPAPGFVGAAGLGTVALMDREAVRAALGGLQILDARSEAEHRGDDMRANARGGRLPGAALVAHATMLDGGRIRDAGALRGLFDAAGLRPGGAVVTHCDGGGRAALAAAAALRAGFADVRVYYHSFADWAADESCPVERP